MYQNFEQLQTTQNTNNENTRMKNMKIDLCQCRNNDENKQDDSIVAIEQSKIVLTWIENALRSPMIQETIKQIIQNPTEWFLFLFFRQI